MLSETEKAAVQRRLSRIAGQVAGIQRMVDEERYCIDILTQVSAVRSALAKVGEAVLAQHFETCLADAFERGDERTRREKIQELMKVFARHGSV